MEMTSASASLTSSPIEPYPLAGYVQLTELPVGVAARVVSVADGDSPEMCRRLAELGFLPGEKLRIVARGFMSREPLAVRIGTSTFALRRFEAACVRVAPESSHLR